MGSSKTIMDLFQPAAKRFKLSSPHCCASDNTPNSKPLLQVVSRKLPLSSKSSGSSSAITTSLTAEQQSRIEFNRYVAKSKRNLKACSQKVSKAKEEGSGYVKLEELLAEETWLEVLHGELQKPYAKRLCEFVEKEIKDSGVDIFPPQHLIFNALNTTPFDRVKAVIIGQDPYHGPGQAMGLSFSVPEGVKIPSSLANIFKEIHQDVGCRLPSHGNLEKWAVQLGGIKLILTQRKDGNNLLMPLSKQFQIRRKELFFSFGETQLKKNPGGILNRLINVTKHHILKAAHPSGLSANRGFFGCRHFSRTNQILEQMGMNPIDWQL
ncbi:uracil-DNA glycosylase, mitochondrial isoform X2 [Citrus sinensis]|uniref:uracil-DNA glycosylase, mitochondrial isoform X2 n=1 Tax=Citrus sinensis TaxID=2711 RepID=UPI00227894BF|nr:uracil-DNA glycosylase, mitochondrial isoform X2 [Citrus sinensis]